MISSWLWPPNPIDCWWDSLTWQTQEQIGWGVAVLVVAGVWLYGEWKEAKERMK